MAGSEAPASQRPVRRTSSSSALEVADLGIAKLAQDLRKALAEAERARIEAEEHLAELEAEVAEEEEEVLDEIQEVRELLGTKKREQKELVRALRSQEELLRIALEVREAEAERQVALRKGDALDRELQSVLASTAEQASPKGHAGPKPADSATLRLSDSVGAVGADAVERMLRAEAMSLRTALRFYGRQEEEIAKTRAALRQQEALWAIEDAQRQEALALAEAEDKLRASEALLEDSLAAARKRAQDSAVDLAAAFARLGKEEAALAKMKAEIVPLQEEVESLMRLTRAADVRINDLEQRLLAGLRPDAGEILEELGQTGLSGAAALVFVLARLCGTPRLAFLVLDVNRSGKLSTYEFDNSLRLRLSLNYEAITGLKLRALFKVFDYQRLGVITEWDLADCHAEVWEEYGNPTDRAIEEALHSELQRSTPSKPLPCSSEDSGRRASQLRALGPDLAVAQGGEGPQIPAGDLRGPTSIQWEALPARRSQDARAVDSATTAGTAEAFSSGSTASTSRGPSQQGRSQVLPTFGTAEPEEGQTTSKPASAPQESLEAAARAAEEPEGSAAASQPRSRPRPAETARKSLEDQQKPSPPISGPLLKHSSNLSRPWRLRWFEIRAGQLVWWDSPAAFRDQDAPAGSFDLAGIQVEGNGSQFTLRTTSGKSKSLLLDTDTTAIAKAAGWSEDVSKELTPERRVWVQALQQEAQASTNASLAETGVPGPPSRPKRAGPQPLILVRQCDIRVTSVDHTSVASGMFFNFDREDLDLAPDVARTLWVTNLRTRERREVIVWGNTNGGSTGNAHGRDASHAAAPGQFQVGDVLQTDLPDAALQLGL